MKKLMVMAAVAVSAIALNAANVDWGIDVYSAGSSDNYWDGKTYYVINGDASSLITMLSVDGNVAGFNTAISEMITAGTAPRSTFEEWSFGAAEGMFQNAGSQIYAIAMTDGTTPDSTFFYSSTSTAGKTYEEGQQSPGTATMSYDDTPWTSATIAAPEPTSGLLLLIGVAGLALRRRRA